MNTMEINKLVAGVCGSLLAFLLISMLAHSIYDTHSDEVAYSIEVEETGGEEAVEEEVDIAAVMAEADAASGEKVFRKCAACHKLDGSDGVGPHLNGVVNREIASVGGFNYSGALTSLEGNWDAEQLYGFLEDPKGYAPGTAMAFAGLKKSSDRADVIAYLESNP
ncbi:c-type cytochrome [Amaricoccus tamworthensis]|uniref:c-type cytochrome n=1 Tax=Amaricoccus tamworthensis TaxID=57002 RepID=UPI003C7C624B